LTAFLQIFFEPLQIEIEDILKKIFEWRKLKKKRVAQNM